MRARQEDREAGRIVMGRWKEDLEVKRVLPPESIQKNQRDAGRVSGGAGTRGTEGMAQQSNMGLGRQGNYGVKRPEESYSPYKSLPPRGPSLAAAASIGVVGGKVERQTDGGMAKSAGVEKTRRGSKDAGRPQPPCSPPPPPLFKDRPGYHRRDDIQRNDKDKGTGPRSSSDRALKTGKKYTATDGREGNYGERERERSRRHERREDGKSRRERREERDPNHRRRDPERSLRRTRSTSKSGRE